MPSTYTARTALALSLMLSLCRPLMAAEPGKGAFAEITAPLEIVLERDASRLPAAKRLARLYVEGGNWSGALRVLERSRAHAGKDAEYLGFLGTVLRHEKRPADAVEAYRSATRLAPADGRWWAGLGFSLEEMGRRQEARAAFETASSCSDLPPALAKAVSRRVR